MCWEKTTGLEKVINLVAGPRLAHAPEKNQSINPKPDTGVIGRVEKGDTHLKSTLHPLNNPSSYPIVTFRKLVHGISGKMRSVLYFILFNLPPSQVALIVFMRPVHQHRIALTWGFGSHLILHESARELHMVQHKQHAPTIDLNPPLVSLWFKCGQTKQEERLIVCTARLQMVALLPRTALW